jgi:hypothetical protein
MPEQSTTPDVVEIVRRSAEVGSRLDGNSVSFSVFLERGHPARGAGWMQFRYASFSTCRNGLIHRVTLYTDIDERRAAAERLAEEQG